MSDSNKTLLVVEDDPGLQSQLRWSFDDLDVVVAGDRESALAQLRRYEPPVVTLDLGLPPDPGGASEGLATLEAILRLQPGTKVIVVTGNDDRAHAVEAVGMGAYDYYQKPIDPELLNMVVQRAFKLQELEQEKMQLMQEKESSPLRGIIATGSAMLKVCRTVERVAPTDVTTLILGESGTGKELLAKALHRLSNRANERFLAINCAAIPETLLESELFGYEKGAFTGAAKQTQGKIEYADKGTFFLDEVGDLPMSLQAKLLRFIQERVIERVGGRKEIPVDVRIVCATHRDLQQLIADGRFREDLYYRISEMTVLVPPLRDREGDITLLARSFLQRFGQEQGKVLGGFTHDALTALENHPWPGNVREMENRVKRAVIMAEGKRVTPEDLELDSGDAEQEPLNLREVREAAEHRAVVRALSFSENNVSKAAELLGITRPTLYTLLNKYKINV
ncbi:MAG: PEP-CTERM-box response regulator transcription factor [Chromatiales bacterium]|nr:PEP-CTERM-box response regulator transcription factor [Chromatiales bacterium]